MLNEQQQKDLERDLDKYLDDLRAAKDDEDGDVLKYWYERLDQIIFRQVKLK